MQRAIPGGEHYRSPEYDFWMAYYDEHFHNVPPSDLTARQMKLKIRLREWLNEEQGKRRKPRLIQGFLPRGHEFEMLRRFKIEDGEADDAG